MLTFETCKIDHHRWLHEKSRIKELSTDNAFRVIDHQSIALVLFPCFAKD